MIEPRTLRPMPIGSQDCTHCAGTGGPSPWEYGHYVWVKGEPIAVCGTCKGAGMLSRFGRRISARKVWNAHRYELVGRINAVISRGLTVEEMRAGKTLGDVIASLTRSKEEAQRIRAGEAQP